MPRAFEARDELLDAMAEKLEQPRPAADPALLGALLDEMRALRAELHAVRGDTRKPQLSLFAHAQNDFAHPVRGALAARRVSLAQKVGAILVRALEAKPLRANEILAAAGDELRAALGHEVTVLALGNMLRSLRKHGVVDGAIGHNNVITWSLVRH